MKDKQTRCQVTMKNSLTCEAKGLRTTLLQHRGVQSFFHRMTFLLLLFVGFCGNAWAQTVISAFAMPTENPSPVWGGNNEGSIGDDGYSLGNNGGVYYFAQGLKDMVTNDGVTTRNFVKRDNGYKLQADDIEIAHFKLQFAAGHVRPGDILTVGANQVYNTAGAIKYKVGGSNVIESGDYTANGPLVEISHIIRSNEIQTDGENQYIRLGRCSWPDNSIGFATFTITRPAGHTVTFSGLYGGGTVTAIRNDINSEISSGWTVPKGTEVTFTAVPSGENLPWKWIIDGNNEYSQAPQTITIKENDITVNHEFGSVYVNVYTNNAELGTVNIKHGDTNATTFHVTPYPGDFTITATPVGHGMFDGWYSTADRKPEEKLEGKGQTFTVNNPSGTNNYFAKFIEGKIVDVNVEPIGLNPDIKIYQHGHHEGCSAGNSGDWGTLANHKPMGQYTNIDVTVGDVDGYTFDGWYINDVKQESAPQADYNYGNVNNDATIVAKFTKTINITPKPECGTGHYFDQTKLNAGTDVTLTINSGKGTVVTGDGGGYVSFNFAEGYNLTDIYKWEIGSDNNSNVDFVEFCKNGNTIHITVDGNGQAMKFYTNATDRTLENKYKPGLEDVDEIRIGFKRNTTTIINYFTLQIKPDVMYKVPTLATPTTNEMVIYDSETLNLRITDTNGYWREYTDDTYTEENRTRINTSGNEYSPSYDLSGLSIGHYYFQIKHGGNCKLSHYHTTDPVNVHVEVKATPTNLKVTYDLNGGTGTVPVDGNTYDYKAEANILAPGSISCEGYFFAYWSTSPDGSGTRYSNKAEDGEVKIVVKDNTTLYAIWNKEGFAGYFNFENRLIAQWNIDLADGARLHEPSMDAGVWGKSSDTLQDGKTKTTYTLKSNLTTFSELVYGGTLSDYKIPVFAGLKFKTTAANQVKIVITKSGNEIMNTQLVVAKDVQMLIPYVRNSYRDDAKVDKSAYSWKDTNTDSWPNENKFTDNDGKIKTGSQTYWNEFYSDRFQSFQDCLHHINRDIVYMVCHPTVLGRYWDSETGAITNRCHDDNDLILFNNGGDEKVHGLRNGDNKIWEKLNFTGIQGSDCILTFAKETTIDRIGVNRNLTYSYYTENINATSEGKYTKPFPGLRIIGSPRGAKVADVGATYATYNNAIAMTYGGWPHNGNEYQDGSNNTITDSWGNLTVYYGEGQGEGNNSYDSSQFTSIDVKKVPVATDGFPVYSRELSHAYSESVNPANKSDDGGSIVYHDQSNGEFLLHPDDGGTKAYHENYNPWTLPCRGAYVKFEPTLPGVLNVHILQDAGADYYIADEFGRLVKNNIFVKAGTSTTRFDNTKFAKGHFSINQKDNIKYSFDVYPGKTYYLFSSTAGMGVTGFYFEPYVYRTYNSLSAAETAGYTGDKAEEEYELARQDVGLKTATMTAGPVFKFSDATYDYTNQTASYPGGTQTNRNQANGAQITKDDGNGNQIPDVETYAAQPKTPAGSYPNKTNNVNPLVYDNKAVHVTLDRSFTAGKWSTIVLPYSMNNLQLETVFGEGTKVVLLRDVQHYDPAQGGKTTAYFVYHMNQDIIAGYPYLILPTKSISNVETNAYVYSTATDNTFKSSLSDYTAPSIVEISGVGPNLVTYNGHTYNGMSQYTFKGSYTDSETIPADSYVMSNNKLTKVPNAQTAGAFRGYLAYNGAAEAARGFEITAVSFGDKNGEYESDPSAIEAILLDQGITTGTPDVYSIDGQLVRKNADNLYGLKKGIYIVNGKKYTVK